MQAELPHQSLAGSSITATNCGHPIEEFDGKDDHLVAPAASMNGVSGAFSAAAWVRRYRCDSAWDRLFDFGNPVGRGASSATSTRIGGNDNILFAFHEGTTYRIYRGDQWQGLSTGGSLPCAHWTHVAVTHTAAGQVTIYWDGRAQAAGAVWPPAAVPRSRLYLGKSNWRADPMFHGEMRDLFQHAWNATYGFAIPVLEMDLAAADPFRVPEDVPTMTFT